MSHKPILKALSNVLRSEHNLEMHPLTGRCDAIKLLLCLKCGEIRRYSFSFVRVYVVEMSFC